MKHTTLQKKGKAVPLNMKNSSLKRALVVALFWSLQSQTAMTAAVSSQAQDDDCIDSLYSIHQAEVELSDDKNVRTYILCPNTTYQLATSFGAERKPLNGQSPLILGRSNIHIQCGNDGKSENKCILKGGHFQVHMFDEFNIDLPIDNVVVMGVTFTEVTSFGVLAETKGDLKLIDCVFTVSYKTVCSK